MKRILVTGGAGFLGSHLCSELVNNRNYVIALDNLYTGRLCNIKSLLEHKNFEFLNHDIIDFLDIPVDEIYNAACPASPIHYQKSPTQTIKTCVQGTINMLELAKKYNAKILQFSTSEIYGDPLIHPQVETYWGNVNPNGIRSCYDEGKRCAETLLMDYHNEFGINVKIIRIFNTYGPKMDPKDGRVVSNFIMQALKGDDITIYGDGSQTRSFCYVNDLIRGVLSMMNSPDIFCGPVNIGNPNEFTIKELAKIIIKLSNSSSKLIYSPLPQDDPIQRRPDITLAKKMLNWSPTTDLETGLKKTLHYFKLFV